MGRRVAVLGQGYVGLPLALRATEVGYAVVGFDVDKERVERLWAGESYIEDVPDERLRAALETGRYVPASDIAACADFDVAVIAVPTPLHEGVPDVSYIEQACELLGPYVRRDCCVVLESTTYPGTTTEVVAPILEQASHLVAGEDFRLGYSPERIDPGNETWKLENTPKLVAGVDGASLAAVKAFYDTVVEETVEMKGTAEAELAKLVENTFRHVNIALVNELAMTCGDLGVDIWEAIRGASTKPFGYLPFFPGPGVGGHCVPVDPSFLSWRVRRRMGQTFRFVEMANDVNEHMPDYVVRRLTLGLNRRCLAVNGATVLVLGLAYKGNSTDIRESPAVPVVEQLLELGARVRLADPLAGP
ncbi:MAG TPA: nucleotide sugar dehydrogenase, partial [Acidimicrobiales bacterium]|nr:nucleotide sugar dehydrogenase [Acidimicrobiales bacterium]